MATRSFHSFLDLLPPPSPLGNTQSPLLWVGIMFFSLTAILLLLPKAFLHSLSFTWLFLVVYFVYYGPRGVPLLHSYLIAVIMPGWADLYSRCAVHQSLGPSLASGIHWTHHLFRWVFPSFQYLLLFTTFYALPPDDQSSCNMDTDSPSSSKIDSTAPISIKDHPLKELIISLAKAIHALDPKHCHKNMNARDYLLQALHIIDDPKSEITVTFRMSTPIVPEIGRAHV